MTYHIKGFIDAFMYPKTPQASTTPMMAQYLAARAKAHAASPDCLLFYRMGDFYEMFFEDAVRASAALDIALTKRGQHDGADIPMCGVPVHAASAYLSRLIRKGFRVAVAEQMEDPAEAKKRGAKSVVRRDIVRIITPGTLTDDALLEARMANNLVAVADVAAGLAVAWCDISTGSFAVITLGADMLDAELARLDPREVLVSAKLSASHRAAISRHGAALTDVPPEMSDSVRAEATLKAFYDVNTLDGIGDFNRAEVAASGMVLAYLKETQCNALPMLARLVQHNSQSHMSIDAATRTSLEITRSVSGTAKGSLLHVIDVTSSGLGARLLAARLAAPLMDPATIHARLDLVDMFVADGLARGKIRHVLGALPDIERALQRLSVARGTPRDLAALRDGLKAALDLKTMLGSLNQHTLAPLPPLLDILGRIGAHGADIDRLTHALVAEPPLDLADGNFIAKGYDAALDELRTLAGESRRHIAALEARYQSDTGQAALKIKYNNIIGYHIEVSAKNADGLLNNAQFIHRQTMATAVRFSTPDLNTLAVKIAEAGAKAIALEREHFTTLVQGLLTHGLMITTTAGAVAEIDVACGLAERAAQSGWSRPVVDMSTTFSVEGGYHPVVEQALARQRLPFVTNGCDLGDGQRIWLITGPNMAGKSTFLRQNALIAILAQMGSFVPARSAHIGIVDRLFSRVGASDDLAQGRSTFMVEMVETAAILNQATPRSLVVLDEVGRGTATYDGLAIAWGSLEHLHDVNQCRALFATHYHELITLKSRLQALALYTVAVKVWQDSLVFLHEIKPGAADRSYGLHVAKMAGLPQAVLERAGEVLAILEKGGTDKPVAMADALPLFALRPAAKAEPAKVDPLREAVAAVEPDTLTPRAALDALYALKTLL